MKLFGCLVRINGEGRKSVTGKTKQKGNGRMNINQNQYGMSLWGGQRVGYFREYTKNNEDSPETNKETGTQGKEPKSYREQILEKMEEMAQNIRRGTIQPKFRIGAQEFTVREWEKFLEKFDAAEEALQEEVKAHIEEVIKQAKKEAMESAAANGSSGSNKVAYVSCDTAAGTPATQTAVAMFAAQTVAGTAKTAKAGTMETCPEETAALLTGEITKCSYPTDDPKQKHWYITCYGQDGISCKEAYFDGKKWVNKDLWGFSYTQKGQYEKVMAFLQRFPQDANLRFAAHENFWKDFLAGEIDEDGFVAFFKTTKDGVPDYTYEKDGSTYIDREKAKYAKYMNDFGARLYTGEEMELIQKAILNENKKNMKKLSGHGAVMPVSGEGARQPETEEDNLKTQIVTKPDGAVVLQITTPYGVMELEVTKAQKFGLKMDVRPDDARFMQNPVQNLIRNAANIYK